MLSPFEASPIRKIKLSGLILDLKGLIVLVGPNSSGKTSLLRDIHAIATGGYRTLVVAEGVEFRQVPPFKDYLAFFEKSGEIEFIQGPGQRPRYIKKERPFGTTRVGGGVSQADLNDLQVFYNKFIQHVAAEHGKDMPICEFLYHLGMFECSALFIDQRLTQSLSAFDSARPQAPATLEALRSNVDAQKKFTEEMGKVFKRGAWLDFSTGSSVSIRISETGFVPSIEERAIARKMEKYRTIETEGDGIRSYVAVCITLLLAQRPLCLIDEPEMCLYPPQARALGRFIGKYDSTPSGCTLVATHNSAVLRGILESNPRASVVRLSRSAGEFHAWHVPSVTLREATTRPFSRSEAILDGLFTDGVAICESDGDRIVYESAVQTLPSVQPDVRFIPVGGISGFKDPVRLYRALGVPVAVAADFDFLFKAELPKVLEELGARPDSITALSTRVIEFTRQLRATHPELSPGAAIRELKPLFDDAKNWEDLQKEGSLRSKLNKLIARLNRLAQVKSAGINGLPGMLKEEAQLLLNNLKKLGLFLVPRGELESWVPDLMRDTTKENKSLWATEAARKIEEHGIADDDIWDFVKEVVTFLQSALSNRG